MSIIVYGKPECVYCEVVKERLTQYNIEHEYVDISASESMKFYFMEVLEHKTVPQIYVDGDYYGDSQSVHRLVKELGWNKQ